QSGRAYLNQTKLRGQTVIRLGLGNILTTEKHLRDAWELIGKPRDRSPRHPERKVEGSRDVTLKISPRDPSTHARDDQVPKRFREFHECPFGSRLADAISPSADGPSQHACCCRAQDRMRSPKSVWRVRELRYIPRRKINDHDSS